MKHFSDCNQSNACKTEFENHRLQNKNELYSRFDRKFKVLNYLERSVVLESNSDVLSYISEQLNLKLNARSIILTATGYSYLDNVDFDNVRAIIDLEPINQTRKSDKLIRAVNTLLPDAGIYIGLLKEFTNSMKTFGELVCNGFEIIDISIINSLLYFTAIKTGEPAAC